MIRRIAFAFCLFSASGLALAQVNALPPTRHILVYGDAQARAVPDRFRIDLRFSATDADAGAARERVERSLREVVARLRAAGAAAGDINATALSIGPAERYDADQRRQVFDGTRVERSVFAEFSRKEHLERFLDRLETSKEIQVSEVRTRLSTEHELRDALRTRSIESTRRKAETIARAYGARLGALYSVSDVAPQFDYGIREGDWPELYQWNVSAGGASELDRVTVTGSRISPSQVDGGTSLEAGYVNFDDRIYAVFLLAD